MKISERIIDKLGLPKNARIGKVYNIVVVDGEKFKKLRLDNINVFSGEIIMTKLGDSERTPLVFNYMEQNVILN